LRVWLYEHNIGLPQVPYPNLYSFKPWIQFLVKNKVEGVFAECINANYMLICEMSELRCYLMARILWDPDADTQTVINEFTDAYYGAAGKEIREYIKLIQRQVTAKTHTSIYAQPENFLTHKVLMKAENIFQKALAAVKDDPVRLHRVKIARMAVTYCRLHLNSLQRRLVGDKLLPLEPDAERLLEEFNNMSKDSHARVERHVSIEKSLAEMKKNIPAPTTAIVLCNSKLRLVVVPEYGGRIYSIVDLKSKREFLKNTAVWQGGYEEILGNDYKGSGWQGKCNVIQHSLLSVTLEYNPEEGLVLQRQIKLDPVSAEYSINSTIKSISNKSRHFEWRRRITLKLPGQADSFVMTKQMSGKWIQTTLDCPNDPRFGGDITLKKLPDEWAFWDAENNYAIISTIDNPPPNKLFFTWRGYLQRLVMEQIHQVNLDSGKSVTVKGSYKLIKNFYPWNTSARRKK
jgi:hypothetical protein